MKKTFALILGAVLCLMAPTAAGTDPLISRSYLEGEFIQSLDAALNARLDASDQTIRSGVEQREPGLPDAVTGGGELMLKEGDILTCRTGMTVTPLGGEVSLSRGTLVDVTEGAEIFGSQILRPDHRYITAESADFTVSSPAAVLLCEGGGTLDLSQTPDYFAISRALKSLNLFRGSGSGFGEGFDLHLAPTRGEGLVMFLRILGEEEAALAFTGSHPFTDVPSWLDRYVAWAYAKGYANGVSAGRFGGSQSISAVEYVEFLLRALGYSVAGVNDYTSSLERALTGGILTKGEYTALKSGQFLRAHVAYVSYYALDVPVSGENRTLAQRLTAAGVMTAEQLSTAREQAGTLRIE